MFKQCTACHRIWKTREEFMSDAEIVLIGYQVNFKQLEAGLFLFNHTASRCGTTLACPVKHFIDLYSGPIFSRRLAGTKDCPGYCLKQNLFQRCPAECECAFVREIMPIIRTWPKRRRPRRTSDRKGIHETLASNSG